jgi:membrane protease YdiL (CAAX protease family)
MRALLAGVLIVAISILGSGTGGASPGPWHQDLGPLATLAVRQAIAVLLTLLASALFGGRAREVLALGSPGPSATHHAINLSIYSRALLLMAVLQAIVSAVQYALLPQDMFADLRLLDLLVGEQWALALAVVGLGAPLSEELLFRGFLLSALARSRLGFGRAALVTTSLWTALHAGYSLAGILEVFTIGLFFCWLLWRTGSLRVPIVCHALYNALIVLVVRLVPLPA